MEAEEIRKEGERENMGVEEIEEVGEEVDEEAVSLHQEAPQGEYVSISSLLALLGEGAHVESSVSQGAAGHGHELGPSRLQLWPFSSWCLRLVGLLILGLAAGLFGAYFVGLPVWWGHLAGAAGFFLSFVVLGCMWWYPPEGPLILGPAAN